MLIDHQLPALFNGVSQQPPTVRLPSQCEALVNGFPSVVDGLAKRPASLHVARITTADLASAYLHTINRDSTERYVVVITDGDLKVFDLTGAEKTVAFPQGKTYLDVTDATTDFVAVTVADYTFVVNRTKIIAMAALAADTTAQPTNYWWLNRNIPGAVSIGALGLAAIQQQYLPNPTGGTYVGEVQSFQKLPDTAANGSIYKITGTDESAFVSYYVRKNGGVWDETVAPGLKNAIDATTMPHALVRKSDGTFEFAPFSWANRQVGDETTNPNPTFVGRKIRDVFFHKNRLGFAADEGVIMSRAGDFGNFYRLTTLDLLQDEVIDIAASETKVTKIASAVPFNTGMMLFSDQVQFKVTSGDVFGPATIGLEPATQYNMKTSVRPLPLGADVYFVSEDANWAQVHEYYVEKDASYNEAAEITGHVPRYIPAGVTRIAGSSIYDMIFLLTSAQKRRIYFYKFYWASEKDKAQSAWSYWELGDTTAEVLSLDVIDNFLYCIIKRPDGAYLERIPLTSATKTSGINWQVLLDRTAAVTGSYLSGEGKTSFTLPYPVTAGTGGPREYFRLVRADGGLLAVDASAYEWVSTTQVKLVGNFPGAAWAGIKYEFLWEPSRQYVRNQQDTPILTGRLQLREWTVYFTDTFYFATKVYPYGKSEPTAPYHIEDVVPAQLSEFDGKVIGAANFLLNAGVSATGKYSFGVYGNAAEARVVITNDLPFPCTFQQAEWKGFWHKNSRTQ